MSLRESERGQPASLLPFSPKKEPLTSHRCQCEPVQKPTSVQTYSQRKPQSCSYCEFLEAEKSVCVCVGLKQKPGNVSDGVKLTPKDTASLQGHSITHTYIIAAVHYLRENRSDTVNWLGSSGDI